MRRSDDLLGSRFEPALDPHRHHSVVGKPRKLGADGSLELLRPQAGGVDNGCELDAELFSPGTALKCGRKIKSGGVSISSRV